LHKSRAVKEREACRFDKMRNGMMYHMA